MASSDPTSPGVYTCRVKIDGKLYSDQRFRWDGGWKYLGSDRNFNGKVVDWHPTDEAEDELI